MRTPPGPLQQASTSLVFGGLEGWSCGCIQPQIPGEIVTISRLDDADPSTWRGSLDVIETSGTDDADGRCLVIALHKAETPSLTVDP